MASSSPQPRGSGDNFLSLDTAIKFLDIVKEGSGFIPPAKAAFAVVSAFVTAVNVRDVLFHRYHVLIHVLPGLEGQQTSVCRAWVTLRRHLQGAKPGDGRKTAG